MPHSHCSIFCICTSPAAAPLLWGLSPALCCWRAAGMQSSQQGLRWCPGQSIIPGTAERCCCSYSGLGAAQMLHLTLLATIMPSPLLKLQKNNLKARARHRQDPPHGLHGCARGSSSCSSSSSCPSSNADLTAWRQGCIFSFFCLCFSSSVFAGLILEKKRQDSGVVHFRKVMIFFPIWILCYR